MRRAWPALALVLLLAACGGGTASPPADSPGSTQAAAAREQAPELSGTTLDGKEVALADFRGTPVFVKFFASW